MVKDRQPCGGVEVPLEVPRTPRVVEPILRARGGVYVDQHLEVILPAELDEAVELFERAIPAANERLPRNEDPYEVSRKKRSESAQSEGVAWRSKRLALTVRDRDADDVGSRCCDGLDVLMQPQLERVALGLGHEGQLKQTRWQARRADAAATTTSSTTSTATT